MIGNTDASGQVGRRVAERLAERRVPQRLIVPDGVAGPRLPCSETATITDGHLESMRNALAGVDTLFPRTGQVAPGASPPHTTAVDAAIAAGIKRIVYSSFVGASPEAIFTLARDHYATEVHIRSKPVDFTFLRGSAYFEVLRWIIGADGVIRGPAGDGRVARWHATTWPTPSRPS
jgi:NAD(P)H dehydrogenase (quinone)